MSKIIKIEYLGKAPEKQNEHNTIIARDTAIVTFEYDDGILEELEYNVIFGYELYSKIEKSEIINISNCIIINLEISRDTIFLGKPMTLEKVVSLVKQVCISTKSRNKFLEEKNKIDIKLARIDATNAIFDGDTYFKGVFFNEDTIFKSTLFTGNMVFEDSTFFKSAEFRDSLFLKKATFKGCVFSKESYFSSCLFEDATNFVNSSFVKKSLFIACNFKADVDFGATIFENISDFSESKFCGSTSFRNTEFHGISVFIDTSIKVDISFTAAQFLMYADFSGANFGGHARFINTMFKNVCSFATSNFQRLTFSRSYISEYGDFTGCQINEANRETFRIIKHELLKINNRLDAVEYFKREIEEKWKEAKPHSFEKNLLSAYSYVNDYGTDSKRALRVFSSFTLIFLILFTFMGYGNCYFGWALSDCESFIEASRYTAENLTILLNPTHKVSELHGEISVFGIVISYLFRLYIPIMFFFILQPLKKFKSW